MQPTDELVRREHGKLHISAALNQHGSIYKLRLLRNTPQISPLTPSTTASIMRRGAIIPLTLARRQSPCGDQAFHQASPVPRFPSDSTLLPTIFPASLLDRESLGFSGRSMLGSATVETTASLPANITARVFEEPSLRLVKQGTYPGRSLHNFEREPNPDFVLFDWRSSEGVCDVSVVQTVHGTHSASLNDAHDTVLERHGVNVTLRVLVSQPPFCNYTALI